MINGSHLEPSMDLTKYRAWNLLRRTKKRALRRAQRRLDSMAVRLIALRHHRVWGEPRLSDLMAAEQIAPLPYPHFIIIGAPKCGTSWLQGALGQHPNVIVVPDEIEYFSSNVDKYPLAWYRDLFAHRVNALSHARAAPFVVGEKSARYCSIPRDRIEVVHRLLPRARLVLMTRDPVARHWSHVKQYYAKRRNREREGGDVLNVSRRRLFGFLTRTRMLGEFSQMIANWTSVYPPEQLLIVSQEQTLADPRGSLDAVLAHLGVTTAYDAAAIRLLAKQRNQGPRIAMPDDVATFLQEMFATERHRLQALLNGRGVVNAAEIPRAARLDLSSKTGKAEPSEDLGRHASGVYEH